MIIILPSKLPRIKENDLALRLHLLINSTVENIFMSSDFMLGLTVC